MKKSELLYNIAQDMALERMQDNINTMADDISQINLDIVTVREELAELKRIVKEWRKNKSGETDKRA